MKGKLITFEGCEGVGKSTQTALLKEYFLSNGIPAVFTREPGGTAISEQIRKIILNKDNVKMDSVTELMLYVASRRQLVGEFIRPHLACGEIVVCDRFTDSTLAYQGYARKVDKNLIDQLNGAALGDVKIDLTVFLDYPPRDAFVRKGGKDASDRMENETLAFHEKVYEGYRDIARRFPERVVDVKADGSPKEIFAKIIETLKDRNIIG